MRKHLDDYFNRMNIRPNVIMEVDRFEAAANFVHKGLGYAVIPQVYFQSFNTRDLDVIHIKPNLGRTIYINYLQKKALGTSTFSYKPMYKLLGHYTIKWCKSLLIILQFYYQYHISDSFPQY